MNKKIVFLFICIIALILGGLYMYHKNTEEHYIDAQKKRLDLFFQSNLNNYENSSIDSIQKTPMGSIEIKGYINNNKKLYFSIKLNKETNYQFNGDIGQSKNLTEKYKKTFSDKQKTPSELIKEKNLNKKDYEADPPLIWGF
ncbi:DUF1310 family protein [Staphylococcus xylosus]|uniref:DUF1310 family protein n=1 Tax=Staphylococcus xylosus TaxID=1288 RepID=UPI0018EA44B8|nr:DUF1310 family protein [Staphylococcus xylosus]